MKIRCPYCGGTYKSELDSCPHCASANTFVEEEATEDAKLAKLQKVSFIKAAARAIVCVVLIVATIVLYNYVKDMINSIVRLV